MSKKTIRLADVEARADGGNFNGKCVQFASAGPNAIGVLSVVGPQTAVKSMMAALNQNGYFQVKISGADPISYYDTYYRSGAQGAYRIGWHRLGFNWVHATAILKASWFLPAIDEETVWKLLTSNQYTTPLLRSWMPWLIAKLKKDGLLKECDSFQCNAGKLHLETKALDAVVSAGLQCRALQIPPTKEVA